MTQVNSRSEWVELHVFGDGSKKISLTEQEERELAIHEAGHFVSNQELLQDRKKIWCITIIPTDDHFGANIFLKDKYFLENKEDYENEIAVLVSGKIASEQMGFKARFYEKDLIEAYECALECVEKYYPKGLEDKEEQALLLITKGGNIAKKILKENEDKLETIAQALLFRKVLLGEEAQAIYDGTLTIEELEPLELD